MTRNEKVKAIKREKLPFTLGETINILNIAKNGSERYNGLSYRNYLIILFSSIGTGARNSAVRLLKKKDLENFHCNLNCETCIPTVKLTRKSKSERNLEDQFKYETRIQKQACKLLKDYISKQNSESEYVFISREKNSGPLTKAQINNILQEHTTTINI